MDLKGWGRRNSRVEQEEVIHHYCHCHSHSNCCLLTRLPFLPSLKRNFVIIRPTLEYSFMKTFVKYLGPVEQLQL